MVRRKGSFAEAMCDEMERRQGNYLPYRLNQGCIRFHKQWLLWGILMHL